MKHVSPLLVVLILVAGGCETGDGTGRPAADVAAPAGTDAAAPAPDAVADDADEDAGGTDAANEPDVAPACQDDEGACTGEGHRLRVCQDGAWSEVDCFATEEITRLK